MKKLLVIVLLFIPVFAENIVVEPCAIDPKNYVWVTYMSEGQQSFLDNGSYAYRVIITTSEIYKNIYIEKVTYEEEGSGKKIVERFSVDVDDLKSKFGLKGEFANVDFLGWEGPSAFVLIIKDKKYSFILRGNKLEVTPFTGTIDFELDQSTNNYIDTSGINLVDPPQNIDATR